MTEALDMFSRTVPVAVRPAYRPGLICHRVVLVGTHPLFRVGLRSELNRFADFKIIGEADGVSGVVELLSRSIASLIVVDQVRPGEAKPLIRSLLHHIGDRIPIVVFGSNESAVQIQQLHEMGVAEFASKALDTEALITVLRQTIQSRPVVLPIQPRRNMTTGELLTRLDETKPKKPLSGRELEILEAIAKGYSNKEVAQVLCISAHTLKNHLNNIFKKLEVEDRTQALMLSVRNGWIKL
jgi:two-component system, NarL family, response regulator DegU